MTHAIPCKAYEEKGKKMMMRPGKHLRNIVHANWDPTQFLPLDEMIATQGVASELGVSARTVQSWEAKGWMPHRQQRGKELLYRRTDIAQLKTVLALAIHCDPRG